MMDLLFLASPYYALTDFKISQIYLPFSKTFLETQISVSRGVFPTLGVSIFPKDVKYEVFDERKTDSV